MAQEVLYATAADGPDYALATVVSIHRDDFPRVYYTVSIGGNERQTLPARLKPVEHTGPADKGSSENRPALNPTGSLIWKFQVCHGMYFFIYNFILKN